MAVNALRGEGELVAGDKTYKLVLDANALIYAQGLTKKKPRVMVSEIFADPEDTELLRALLWGALQKHHECHLIEAGEILSEAGEAASAAAVLNVAAEAYGLGDAEDGEDANPPVETASTTG